MKEIKEMKEMKEKNKINFEIATNQIYHFNMPKPSFFFFLMN